MYGIQLTCTGNEIVSNPFEKSIKSVQNKQNKWNRYQVLRGLSGHGHF